MSETFKFTPARRSSVIPLIGLMGTSGGGKTLTSLLLMRGLVGPSGRIRMIDSDNKRGQFFESLVPGGYEVLDLDPPYRPARLLDVANAALDGGCDGLVWDSFSDEWDGEEGYLETKEAAIDRMTKGDYTKRNAYAMAAAGQEKPWHNKLIRRLLRSDVPIILCFRGKEKVSMTKDDRGKTQIKPPEHISAIQDSDVIFKMLIAGEVFSVEDSGGSKIGGFFRSIKHTHPDILPMLPSPGEQLGISHGEAISAWARGGAAAEPKAPPASKAVQKLKGELWKLTMSIHGEDVAALEKYLHDATLIRQDETLSTLTEDRLKDVIHEVKELANAS